MNPQPAELYDASGKMPQKWIWWLPFGGAVIGFSKQEVQRNYQEQMMAKGKKGKGGKGGKKC